MNRTVIAFLAAITIAPSAWAQVGPPATLAKVTVVERRRQADPEQDGDQRRHGARHR